MKTIKYPLNSYRMLIGLLPVVWIFFLAISRSSAEESCTALLKSRCTTCHYLTRVCQKVEKNQTENSWFGGFSGSWKRTIKNMVRQGAKLDNDEQKQLTDCLSEPTPEVLDLCGLKK